MVPCCHLKQDQPRHCCLGGGSGPRKVFSPRCSTFVTYALSLYIGTYSTSLARRPDVRPLVKVLLPLLIEPFPLLYVASACSSPRNIPERSVLPQGCICTMCQTPSPCSMVSLRYLRPASTSEGQSSSFRSAARTQHACPQPAGRDMLFNLTANSGYKPCGPRVL